MLDDLEAVKNPAIQWDLAPIEEPDTYIEPPEEIELLPRRRQTLRKRLAIPSSEEIDLCHKTQPLSESLEKLSSALSEPQLQQQALADLDNYGMTLLAQRLESNNCKHQLMQILENCNKLQRNFSKQKRSLEASRTTSKLSSKTLTFSDALNSTATHKTAKTCCGNEDSQSS